MSTARFFTLALLAALIAAGAGAESCWAAPARGRCIYSYQPRSAALAQARVEVGRRYSYAPGAFSSPYSPAGNGGTLGLRSTYRPGPGYAPRQGINSATVKVQGL